MQTTAVLAGTLKKGDKLAPESYGLQEGCSPVEIVSVVPYGNSHHSVVVRGFWDWEGARHTSLSADRHVVLVKTQEVDVVCATGKPVALRKRSFGDIYYVPALKDGDGDIIREWGGDYSESRALEVAEEYCAQIA